VSISFFKQPISSLKGIGLGWERCLEALKIKTFWDLLVHLPLRYEHYRTGPLHSLESQLSYLWVKVQEIRPFNKFWRVRCVCFKHSTLEELSLVFFKKPAFPFRLGGQYLVSGLVQKDIFGYFITHPSIHPKNFPEIQPVYALTKGLLSRHISGWVQRIFESYPAIPCWLPETSGWPQILTWPSHRKALESLHFPKEDSAFLEICRQRLAFDELLAQQCALQRLKVASEGQISWPLKIEISLTDQILKDFGHSLSPEQERAWQDIQQDLSQQKPMMRLIHGDVGSGKTILAALTLAQAAGAGLQGCLLAPTEILALQHFETLKSFFKETSVDVKLVLGGHRCKQLGTITVGTHALFQDKIEFDRLAVVVIDEQHRFGVLQRLKMSQKSTQTPHMLFTTATPIPRTFEMTLFQHLYINHLGHRQGHRPVKNYVTSLDKEVDLYRWIGKCINAGQRVYWVCPYIESKEEDPATFVPGQVTKRYQMLQEVFPEKVGLLHGKMGWKEKEQALQDFQKGVLPVLVSTTVIEVGVHVPLASTMVIESCQQFGLAQLHQLRGRVGRGQVPGHCFFVYDQGHLSEIARKRLNIIRSCDDGLKLSEEDWKLRGPGSLWGLQQSGMPIYRFADLMTDEELLIKAKAWAETLGPKHPERASYLIDLFQFGQPELWNAG
jgi:ATP-dependent DNA helicase RecG